MCIRYEKERYIKKSEQQVRDNPPAGNVRTPIRQSCDTGFGGDECPAVGTVWVEYEDNEVKGAKMGPITRKSECIFGDRRNTQA